MYVDLKVVIKSKHDFQMAYVYATHLLDRRCVYRFISGCDETEVNDDFDCMDGNVCCAALHFGTACESIRMCPVSQTLSKTENHKTPVLNLHN